MPIYVYVCSECVHKYECIQNYFERPRCPKCGGEGERQPTAASTHFKGEGWTPKSEGGRTK